MRCGGGRAARCAQRELAGPRRSGAASISLRAPPGEFVAVLGPQRQRQVDAAEGDARPAGDCAAARSACSAARPARANARRSATCRSATASTRDAPIRGVDLVRLGLDGTAGACRCRSRGAGSARGRARAPRRERVREAIELVGASAYADRPLGELLRRRAAAPADRPGARASPANPDARRAARQPRPAQPGGGDRARAAHLPDGERRGAAGGPRRQSAAVVSRPGDLPGGRPRAAGVGGGGDHQRPR